MMSNQSPPAKNPPEIKTDITLPDQKSIEEKEERQLVVQIKMRGTVGGMKLC